MSLEQVLIFLAVGAIAGWLAGLILKGGGFGLAGNLIVGILGAVIGGWIFSALSISIGSPIVSSIVSATVGAIVLLLAIGFLRK